MSACRKGIGIISWREGSDNVTVVHVGPSTTNHVDFSGRITLLFHNGLDGDDSGGTLVGSNGPGVSDVVPTGPVYHTPTYPSSGHLPVIEEETPDDFQDCVTSAFFKELFYHCCYPLHCAACQCS